MTKKSFKLLFTIIGALLLFSAILCIAVFGVVSLSSSSALADSIHPPYYCEGYYSQLVNSIDGRTLDYQNMTFFNCLYDDTYSAQYLLISYTGGGSNCTVSYPISFTLGHTYVLRFKLYYCDPDALTTSVRAYWSYLGYVDCNMSSNTWFYNQVSVFTADSDVLSHASISFSSNRSFGLSMFEVVDITDLNFYYSSPATSALPITNYNTYMYYFTESYLPYQIQWYYSTDSEFLQYGYNYAYLEGYTNGYSSGQSAGYDSGYSAGETAGYNDGYTVGYNAGGEAGYTQGLTHGYSLGFNDGVISADSTVNTSSASYISGYDTGYSTGYVDAVNSLSNTSFVCSSDNFVPSYGPTLFENVRGNYWAIYGITDNPAWLQLNVGYTDIFNMSFEDLTNSYPSFSWYLPTASVTNNVLSYSFYSYTSLYFGYNSDSLGNTLYLSDSSDPTDPWANYHIFIEMGSNYTSIHTDFFTDITTNSGYVPNFYTGSGVDIFALEFSVSNTNYESYTRGFDDGIIYADNRLNLSSLSYQSGYSAGLDSASSVTFTDVISSAVDVPVKTVSSLLNFDFLGINLKAFIYSLLSLGLIIGIIKLIIGARS